MLALTDAALARLVRGAREVPRRLRGCWLQELAREIDPPTISTISPPKVVIARRERSRRSRARRRAGTRVWSIELADAAAEGIIDALVSFGRLGEHEVGDPRRVAQEIGHQLAWFAEHWRSIRR
jgi:hypothetical protein